MLASDTKRQLLNDQRDEITEHHIYHRPSRIQKSPENQRILERIAEDEKKHHDQWKRYTGEDAQQPLKAAFHSGTTYVATVILLIMPYLALTNYYVSLACTLSTVVLIIAFFNYDISVAMDQPFKKRFAEMASLSLGIAGLSFLLCIALRVLSGVEV